MLFSTNVRTPKECVAVSWYGSHQNIDGTGRAAMATMRGR